MNLTLLWSEADVTGREQQREGSTQPSLALKEEKRAMSQGMWVASRSQKRHGDPYKPQKWPWLAWLSGLSASLRPERSLLVRFLVRALAWVMAGPLVGGVGEAPD